MRKTWKYDSSTELITTLQNYDMIIIVRIALNFCGSLILEFRKFSNVRINTSPKICDVRSIDGQHPGLKLPIP